MIKILRDINVLILHWDGENYLRGYSFTKAKLHCVITPKRLPFKQSPNTRGINSFVNIDPPLYILYFDQKPFDNME